MHFSERLCAVSIAAPRLAVFSSSFFFSSAFAAVSSTPFAALDAAKRATVLPWSWTRISSGVMVALLFCAARLDAVQQFFGFLVRHLNKNVAKLGKGFPQSFGYIAVIAFAVAFHRGRGLHPGQAFQHRGKLGNAVHSFARLAGQGRNHFLGWRPRRRRGFRLRLHFESAVLG